MNISKYDFLDILQTYVCMAERLEGFAINLSYKGCVDTEIMQRLNVMRNLVLRKKQFLVERYLSGYKRNESTSLTF